MKVTIHIVATVVGAFLCFLTGSCKNSKIEENMFQMLSDTIAIPYDSLLYYSQYGGDTNYRFHAPYQMVVFLDSMNCSKCTIKMLFEWNELFKLEKERRVEFVYIVSSKDTLGIIEAYNNSALKHGIHLDTCGVFRSRNPHVPSDAMFHTFMIDKNHQVVLVGNPIRSPQIRNLFNRIININQ